MQAEGGRSGPEPEAACEVVGPAGLEPAIAESQVTVGGGDAAHAPVSISTSASTVAPDGLLAEAIRLALASGVALPRDLRVDLARLLVEGA